MEVSDCDVIYISYDEPNCHEFWEDLQEKVPWAQRVHGVKGFDSAHKAAAELSETERFITVDADNIVLPEFFDLVLNTSNYEKTDVFSWGGKNMINGLIYGNGGLKCWPRELVLNMRTHENADQEKNEIEFCWDINYIQMNNYYSEVWSNGSPYQAFRAGFREGVKMSLDQGVRVGPKEFLDKIYYKNLHRLLIWSTIGSDVQNGDWAIYGARLGAVKTIIEDWDFRKIKDYDWFQDFWNRDIKEINDFQNEICYLGEKLRTEVGLDIAEIGSQGSKFFKKVYTNQPRIDDPMKSEKEVEKEEDNQ